MLSGEGMFPPGFDLSICREDDGSGAASARLAGGEGAAGVRCSVIIAAHGAAIAGGCAALGAGDLIVTDAGARSGTRS